MKEYISKCGEYKLEIVSDNNAESPDEWGNEDIFLVYDHREFTVERDGFYAVDIYDYLYLKNEIDLFTKNKDVNNLSEKDQEEYDDLINALGDFDDYKQDYYIFPVAAYIHSGVSLSLTNSFKRQGFDTSVTGFVLVKKAIVEPNHESSLTWDSKKLAEEYAESLIETWNTYLSGDVYGFRLYKADKKYFISADNFQNLIDSGHGFDDYTRNNYFTEETEWEEIDSCYGFYGDDIETNGILDHIEVEIEFDID